ncbi:aconitase family protein [Streptomyces sp. NPDC001493]
MGRILAEKLWDTRVVRRAPGEPDLLHIDLHMLHEVTSPQVLGGLREAGRPVRRPDLTIATEDHNVRTTSLTQIEDPVARKQSETLRANCKEFGLRVHFLGDPDQASCSSSVPSSAWSTPA